MQGSNRTISINSKPLWKYKISDQLGPVKVFNPSIFCYKVWDTAGQERFRSMAPMYYRNANAALLVFDITQYGTFEAMKTWVKGKILIAELSE